jgi:peptidoglycan hydrolase-like protein with peptidoglycan-binding domain
VPAAQSVTRPGQVLGAQKYNFAAYMLRGSNGEAVLNLQKLLIALHFLAAGNAVGHFGPLTQAAVQAYQKSNGIFQTGTVGPVTRAVLNKETASY